MLSRSVREFHSRPRPEHAGKQKARGPSRVHPPAPHDPGPPARCGPGVAPGLALPLSAHCRFLGHPQPQPRPPWPGPCFPRPRSLLSGTTSAWHFLRPAARPQNRRSPRPAASTPAHWGNSPGLLPRPACSPRGARGVPGPDPDPGPCPARWSLSPRAPIRLLSRREFTLAPRFDRTLPLTPDLDPDLDPGLIWALTLIPSWPGP